MNVLKFSVYGFLFAVLCGCSTDRPIDLIGKSGMEKPDETMKAEEFQPYSKVVKPYGDAYLINNPGKNHVSVIGFNPLKLDPEGLYELRLRYVGKEGTAIFVWGNESAADGKLVRRQLLARTISYLNVNGVTGYTKPFAVSAGCENFVPSLMLVGSRKNSPASRVMIEKLEIARIGTMKRASAELRKINFAEKYDFSKYPDGGFSGIHRGNGEKAKKWSNIKAEIIRQDGEAMLHIVRKPENYIYPWMNLAHFPIDPQNYFIRLTMKIKGKGTVRPGLWWKRRSLAWDYYNSAEVKLTDKWQTVTVIRPCLSPDVKNATMSLSSTGDGEFFIKDISVNML